MSELSSNPAFFDSKICGFWDSPSVWNYLQFPEQTSLFHSFHKLSFCLQCPFLWFPWHTLRLLSCKSKSHVCSPPLSFPLLSQAELMTLSFSLLLVLVQTANLPVAHYSAIIHIHTCVEHNEHTTFVKWVKEWRKEWSATIKHHAIVAGNVKSPQHSIKIY